jgi:hypothetical protein
MFPDGDLSVVNSPRLPRISPRSYQQKTTPKHPLFSKTPSKSQVNQVQKVSTNPPDFFGRTTAFFE